MLYSMCAYIFAVFVYTMPNEIQRRKDYDNLFLDSSSLVFVYDFLYL